MKQWEATMGGLARVLGKAIGYSDSDAAVIVVVIAVVIGVIVILKMKKN